MLTQAQLARVWAPKCTGPWIRIQYPGEGSVLVRPAAAEAFRAKAQVYAAFRYQTRQVDTGGYVCRTTATGGSSRHAEGIADDTNWNSNPYGTTRTDRPAGMNAAICAIRTNNGKQVFNNGIFWRGSKDPMHDEIVCAPSDLATGINWATVAGRGAQIVLPPKTAAPANPLESEEDDDMKPFLIKYPSGQYFYVCPQAGTRKYLRRPESIATSKRWGVPELPGTDENLKWVEDITIEIGTR